MTIDAVVFDVGNVLIEWDVERLYRELIPDDETRARFLAHVLTVDVNVALDRGASFSVLLGALAEAHPEWRDEILAFHLRWGDTLGPEDASMVALVAELRAGGVKVFALTNFSAETWPVAVERHQWLTSLDGAIVSGQEQVVKPNAAIFERLVERFGLTPERTWFTDDSQRNVDAAVAFGLVAERFIDADTTRASLRALGVLPGSA